MTEDVTVDGALVVPSDVTVNLNGHALTAKALRGKEILEDAGGAKYERLDYIESDGTQYIITDFTPAAGDRAEIQIAFTEDGGNYSGIISTRSSDGGNGFSLWRTGSNGGSSHLAYAIRADYGTYGPERFLSSLGDKMKASAGIRRIIMHSGWPGNGKYAVVLKDESGAQLAIVSDLDAGSYNPAGPLALMTNGKWIDGTFTPGDGFNAKLRFYWLKFDGNGEGSDGAKCTIYPVRRVSDGTLGAFNTVTRKFLPPATGKFTKCGEYDGTVGGTVSGALQGVGDLTVDDASRVTQVGTLYNETYSMANLFNNNYVHPSVGAPSFGGDVNWSTQRILARKADLPIKADYDFGDGTPQVVDAYRFYFAQSSDYTGRAPKAWKFFGSNNPAAKGGADSLWTLLDERTDETGWGTSEQRVYSFRNETAYRFYRISFEEENGKDDLLELVQLEYFRSGRLCIDVPQGETSENQAIAIDGPVKVQKTGRGTFIASKANQTYTGGTEVSEGQLRCGLPGYNKPFGPVNSEIRISKTGGNQGVMEMNGKCDYNVYQLVLNGGLLQNTLVAATDQTILWENLRLEDDSALTVTQFYGFIGNGYGPTEIDLNGHKLTVNIAGNFLLCDTTIHDGTFDVASGGYIQTRDGKTVTATNNVTMKLNCAFRMFGPMDVENYESLYTDGWNRNDGKMRVFGTFTPTTDYFWGCEMQNGSTLDLSSKSDTWNTRNLKGSDMQGVRDVTFAKGTTEAPSTITIKIDPSNAAIRSLAKQKDRETGAYSGYIVKWTDTATASRPDDTVVFQLDSASQSKFKLETREDGLVLYPKSGLVIVIK